MSATQESISGGQVSTERIRQQPNLAPALIWTSGTDAKCNWFNEPWLAFTGRTLAQEIGDGWQVNVHPDDADDYLTTFAEAYISHQPFPIAYRHRFHDGQYRWLSGHAAPVFDREGTFTGHIGSCTDVTEHQNLLAEKARLETQLAQANAKNRSTLFESEERFRLLVESVQDYAIFMLDAQGHIATWNAGAKRFKGYEAEEIIGQHFSRFYTEEDVASGHPEKELKIAAREGRYEEDGWRVRKDGTRFWANVVITALKDETGKLVGFGKVTRDVTERRLRDQERAIAQALEQQRRFLKDVLQSVTQGRLRLCDNRSELPVPLTAEPIGTPIALTTKTLKAVRVRVGDAATANGLPRERTQDLVTAVSECAMNAVQHAGGGTAKTYGDAALHKVQVWFEDAGKGIDLSNLPRATLEAGFSTGGGGIGHGFSLMIACCEKVYLLTGTRGTTVVLEQQAVSPLPAWLQGNF